MMKLGNNETGSDSHVGSARVFGLAYSKRATVIRSATVVQRCNVDVQRHGLTRTDCFVVELTVLVLN